MTHEELRSKLCERDETVRLAEAEIKELRRHKEYIRTAEDAGEELLGRYAKLVPEKLEDLSSAKKRWIY